MDLIAPYRRSPTASRAGLFGALCVVATFAAQFAVAPAPAATKRAITGEFDKRGFTVVALAANGRARSARTVRGKFSLRPTADAVTLHLRAPDGSYAGPVLIKVRSRGNRVVVGLKAGTRLGVINVRAGYARVVRSLPDRAIYSRIQARAHKGKPIGNGRNIGRVRSKPLRSTTPGDGDADGVPDTIDVDDDGDLTLDKLDRRSQARASNVTVADQASEIFDLHTQLPLSLEHTTNANATAVTNAQIDSRLAAFGALYLEILPGDSAELDCGGAAQIPARSTGLAYCSLGGTGTAVAESAAFPLYWDGSAPFSLPPFPACCDEDGDGMGTPIQLPNGPEGGMALTHHANTSQISAGDVLIQRVIRSGVPLEFPAVQQFVFATVPALVGYRDTSGNSTTVGYPVAPSGLGTQGNGFPAAADTNGDVILSLTMWRPQRKPIPGETGSWIDIGGLGYAVVVQHVGAIPGGTTVQKPCPQTAYSTVDPQLTVLTGQSNPGLIDTAVDQPANAANQLTFGLNLTHCLASLGVSWSVGEEANVAFEAGVTQPGAADNAGQYVWFKRT